MRLLLLAAISFVQAVFGTVVPDYKSWPYGRIKTVDGSIAFRYYGTGPPIFLIHGTPQYSVSLFLVDLESTRFGSDHLTDSRESLPGNSLPHSSLHRTIQLFVQTTVELAGACCLLPTTTLQ
jgi:hypothetical protein